MNSTSFLFFFSAGGSFRKDKRQSSESQPVFCFGSLNWEPNFVGEDQR